MLLKTKGRKEIYSSEPEPKLPTGANLDILGVTKSNSPQRCTSGSAFNLCVLKNVSKSKECVIVVAIENAKLKLLKVLSGYNNALCGSSKLFLQQFTLETWDLWIFSTKCDVIFRFRRMFQYAPRFYAHVSLIRFRFRNRDTYSHVLLKFLLGEAGVNSTAIQCLYY